MADPNATVTAFFNSHPELQQRFDWRIRWFEWLLPRLRGDSEDKQQVLDLGGAVLAAARNEGLDEAADIVEQLAKVAPPNRVLGVAAKAIRELAAKNRADGV